jgi:hypothetical protein
VRAVNYVFGRINPWNIRHVVSTTQRRTDLFQQATSRGEKLFFKINVHLNENGHRIAAETIRKALPEFFKGADTPPK